MNNLILASASERRSHILNDLGYSFEVIVPVTREAFYPENARRTAKENSMLKNSEIRRLRPNNIVLSADTVIEFNGRTIAKPSCMDEARSFLREFSGRTHRVLTAVTISGPNNLPETEIEESSVTFKELDNTAIEEYLEKTDPLHKAGAYNIDQHGEMIIKSFAGSYTNVMGLPAELVSKWLKKIQ